MKLKYNKIKNLRKILKKVKMHVVDCLGNWNKKKNWKRYVQMELERENSKNLNL